MRERARDGRDPEGSPACCCLRLLRSRGLGRRVRIELHPHAWGMRELIRLHLVNLLLDGDLGFVFCRAAERTGVWEDQESWRVRAGEWACVCVCVRARACVYVCVDGGWSGGHDIEEVGQHRSTRQRSVRGMRNTLVRPLWRDPAIFK